MILDYTVFLVAALVIVLLHAPLDITLIIALCVIIFARWLLGERVSRRPVT